MVREAESLEGLAVSGFATLGPLKLRLPAIAWARPDPGGGPAGRDGGWVVRERPGAPAGHRWISWEAPDGSLPLDLTVPTPEIAGAAGGSESVGSGVWAVHWPMSDPAWNALVAARPDALILTNARALFSEGEPFVQALVEIREKAGARPVLVLPRVALPHRLALLAYLGADLLDSTETLVRSSDGEFLTPELGAIDPAIARREALCQCPACREGRAVETGSHGEATLEEELRLVRASIRAGRLRELVEARQTAEPVLAELLRYADRRAAALLDARAPVTATATRAYVLRESFRRPEAERFRERLRTRYRPPPSKSVLLLVPCSRTKPYRASRSHRRIAKALDGLPAPWRLHWVSVTSPIGLVPRELEEVAPARHYDIPVTGDWDEAERAAVLSSLRHLLAVGGYRSVLVHLDPQEYDFLSEEIARAPAPVWTMVDDRTTSAESLRRLRGSAFEALRAAPAPTEGALRSVREELQQVAAVQFGSDGAERLFADPLRLQGRPWFQRLTDGHGADLATIRSERGLFQITVAGGRRLLPACSLQVEVDPGVRLEGDLFCPGVRSAHPSIRAGDAVLLVRSGELLAVGEATLPGPLMGELSRGLAVRVRHRASAPVARDPNSDDGTTAPRDGPVV